jgi:hypothetical protein
MFEMEIEAPILTNFEDVDLCDEVEFIEEEVDLSEEVFIEEDVLFKMFCFLRGSNPGRFDTSLGSSSCIPTDYIICLFRTAREIIENSNISVLIEIFRLPSVMTV